MSRPYSEAESHEKADDEVSVFYIQSGLKCGPIDISAGHGNLDIKITSD